MKNARIIMLVLLFLGIALNAHAEEWSESNSNWEESSSWNDDENIHHAFDTGNGNVDNSSAWNSSSWDSESQNSAFRVQPESSDARNSNSWGTEFQGSGIRGQFESSNKGFSASSQWGHESNTEYESGYNGDVDANDSANDLSGFDLRLGATLPIMPFSPGYYVFLA